MRQAESIEKNPFVSIVMPVRNEADFIERGLRAIFAQSYPHEALEIVIADGFSTDQTRAIIEKLKASSDIPIKIVDNPQRIAPTGLNHAIAESKGEIIVRVDGHCEIATDYVANCVGHLQTGKAEGIGGPIETVGATLTARAIAAAMSSTFGVGGSAFRCVDDREMYVDTIAFPAYRRETFERVGLFDEELVRNQDDEFNYRLRKAGGRLLLAPDVRSKYYSRGTLKSLWRQYFQYGFWKVRVLQMHPKQMSLRQFVPFAFVAGIVFLSLGSVFSTLGRWALLGVLGLYLLANSAAAIKAAARSRLAALPLIFCSFIILHVAYGTGFFFGLIKFRHRWREHRREKSLDAAI